MPKKIRRCLYIGLGGTGMNSILHTKKMFIDTYGEVPPMVSFLGIDTDGNAYAKELTLRNGKRISLDANEQVKIQVTNPRPLYETNRATLSWFPQKNSGALQNLKNGAGQVRSNGRFALWYNHQSVATQIANALNRVTSASIIGNEKWSVLGDANPEIHMVFSLCGGTGCGTFINMAYLIRQRILPNNFRLVGYGVLPGVFWAMNPLQMPYVKPNAYGALQDLDWLMDSNFNRPYFHVDNMNAPYKTNAQPFDAIMLIDNKNKGGDTYDDVDNLAQMISMSLVTAAGEIAGKTASVIDNIAQQINSGEMDIADKKAWISGMGVSQIMLRSVDLCNLYTYQYAKNLINKLTIPHSEATNETANAWIDSVKVRENNGRDDVTDYLMPASPGSMLSTIEYPSNPMPEVLSWMASATQNEEKYRDRDKNVKQKDEEVQPSLHQLVTEHLNEQGGVADAEKILRQIRAQVKACLNEMQTELGEWEAKQMPAEGSLKAVVHDLANYKTSIFRKNLTDEKKADVGMAAQYFAKVKREIRRHEGAISYYNLLISEIEKELSLVSKIKGVLMNLSNKLDDQIAELQNGVGKNIQIFQIDLTQKFLDQVGVKDVSLNDFLNQSSTPVENFATITSEKLFRIFVDYSIQQPGAKKWLNMTVSQALDEMPQSQFDKVFGEACKKSSPLLNFDDTQTGHAPQVKPQNYFFVGVNGEDCAKLNEAVSKLPNNPQLCDIGSTDSVIFYRQVGVTPPCTLTAIQDYKDAATRCNWDVHFDAMIEDRMKAESHSLFPAEASDDALKIWVYGLIFNLIRNNAGKFEYIDEENGDALNAYWVSLENAEPNNRAKAFATFKQRVQNPEFHDQMTAAIDSLIQKMGDLAWQEKKKVVKETYLHKISQLNMSVETVKEPRFNDIGQQIREELGFVNKQL